METKAFRNFIIGVALTVTIFGIALRFYNITKMDFFFYDEGLYLNTNRKVFEVIAGYTPKNFVEFKRMANLFLSRTLVTGKPLYLLLTDLRIFFGGLEAWYVSRVVSAVAALLTLILTFLFARRFFDSKNTALLSLSLLAILPSHVFYSRLGIQESLATLCFLSGFYLYVFTKGLSARVVFSALAFFGAYFSNYRLIIAPLFVLFCEFFLSFTEGKKIDIRKYLWHTVSFFFFVVIVGSLYKGANIRFNFTWMFFQAALAKQQTRHLLDFLSYPYYIFRLENILFGVMFFGSIYLCIRRYFRNCFPFVTALFGMAVFSFAADKGARYLCVFTPFMVMAASNFIIALFEEKKSNAFRLGLIVFVFITSSMLLYKTIRIANSRSDYQTAVSFLRTGDKSARVLSTQPLVQNLFTGRLDVLKAPDTFVRAAGLFQQGGYRYLAVCPQSYISWTASGEKFDPPLVNYLNFITSSIEPIKVFPHLNSIMLERFVFEHNENLAQSIAFLKNSENQGAIRIYDLRTCLAVIKQRVETREEPLGP